MERFLSSVLTPLFCAIWELELQKDLESGGFSKM